MKLLQFWRYLQSDWVQFYVSSTKNNRVDSQLSTFTIKHGKKITQEQINEENLHQKQTEVENICLRWLNLEDTKET